MAIFLPSISPSDSLQRVDVQQRLRRVLVLAGAAVEDRHRRSAMFISQAAFSAKPVGVADDDQVHVAAKVRMLSSEVSPFTSEVVLVSRISETFSPRRWQAFWKERNVRVEGCTK